MRQLVPALSVWVAFLSCLSCRPESGDEVRPRPNVLFILADDLGYHDVSVMGSAYYETPNIDRIANEGTVFAHGYAASQVRSPSRATIMSGKFVARHGITDWIGAWTGEAWREGAKARGRRTTGSMSTPAAGTRWSPRGGFFAPWENPNLESGPDGENLSMRLAQETADFIRASEGAPFFAFLLFLRRARADPNGGGQVAEVPRQG